MQERPWTAEPKRSSLGEGAAQAAPTAPHATPRVAKRKRNGPERFWSRWPVRVALAVSLCISSIVHCSVMPLHLQLPHALEVKDVEGEALIAVDVLAGADLAPPPPPPAAELPPSQPAEEEKQSEPAMPRVPPERKVHRDAGEQDALADAPVDAPVDAAEDSSAGSDAALLAAADAGPGGPHDPEAILGSPSVRADKILVTLVVRANVIRTHPVGPRIGRILRAIPQWDEFMSGTDVDPVRDLDWLMISGPSLRNTSRDAMLIHYSLADSVVDRRIQAVSRNYAHGGPYDAGVKGVRATLIYADGAERVILRPQPHFVAVVPTHAAEANARALSAGMSEPHPGEAMYLRVLDPHHPVPEIPDSITEMRMRIVPRADGGADATTDFDTRDPSAASEAAIEIRRALRRHNDALTSVLTHGLFDHVDVSVEGSSVKVRLTATLDQIVTLVTLAEDFLGVQEPTPTPTESSSAAPRSPPPAPRRPR